MEGFVTKGFNIAKNKLYLAPEKGGLGLFNLKNFIAGLQVSWIKRTVTVINDNWKCTLQELGNGDPTMCNVNFNHNNHGIAICNIVNSYSTFKNVYDTENGNYAHIPIFDNPLFGTGRQQQVTFNREFFTEGIMENYGVQVRSLTWKKTLINGSFCPYGEFEFLTGIRINRLQYIKLKQCFARISKKYGPPSTEYVSITRFMSKIKKGSKKYRKILDLNLNDKKRLTDLQQCKSFCKALDVNFENDKRIQHCLSSWNLFYLPNRVRLFLFKYYGNILGTGNRVLHYNPTAEVACTFCTLNRILPAPIETVAHVFFDCPIIFSNLNKIFKKFFRCEVTREKFFTGQFSDNESFNRICSLFLDCLRYAIWQARLTKSNISVYTLIEELNYLLTTVSGISKKIELLFLNCPLMCIDGKAEGREEREGGDGAGQDGHDRHVAPGRP